MKKTAINKNLLVAAVLLLGLSVTQKAQAQTGSAIYQDIYLQSNAAYSVHFEHLFSAPSSSVGGIVYTQRINGVGKIIFESNATWSGMNSTSFVDGYAQKNGTTPFTFPTGDNGKVRPLVLSLPSGATVAYFNANPSTAVTSNAFSSTITYPALPSGAPYSSSAKSAFVQYVSSAEYWHIDGSSTSDITLSWDSSSGISALTNSNLRNLTIIGWNGSQWDAIPSKVNTYEMDMANSTVGFTTTSSTFSSGSISSLSAVDLSQYSIVTFGSHAKFTLTAKAFLSGPYVASSGLMIDSLRTKNLIPLSDPYASFSSFTHKGCGGGEGIPSVSASSILGVTGSNAIVDWVFVEARSGSDSSIVLQTQSALIQRDGDIVSALDGTSPIDFIGLPDSSVFISVRHRNHFGVMSASKETFTANALTLDFTNGNTSGSGEFDYGTSHPVAGSSFNYAGLAQRAIATGVRGMWAGDGSQDGKIKYTAPGDDVTSTLIDVFLYSGNTALSYNYDNAIGYMLGDYDMNGKAKYTAPGDDVTVILINLFSYPLSGFSYNFDNFLEQLP